MAKYRYTDKCNITSEIIRDLRLHNRLSQSALAAKMQVEGVVIDQDAISRIERGTRYVADFELLALCKIFNVSSDYIIGREAN